MASEEEPMQATSETESEEVTAPTYTPSENAVDISTAKDGGLYKEILTEGHGYDQPLVSDTVYVHYVGTLMNGDKFDSSRDRGQQFEFEIGKGKVISGWDVGVATMKKGEVCRLICSPEYAYGASGSPPTIPPNSTLCFEVELFDWKGTDISPGKDGSVLKSSLVKGKYNKPNAGSSVDVYIIGRHEGRVFEERDVTFTQGEGQEQGVVEGVDTAVLTIAQDETARLLVAPKYAFGSAGNATYNIPGGATLTYDVTLKSFEKVKEGWEMNADEKLADSEVLKQKGTEKFKLGKYSSACKNYQKIVEYLEQEEGFTDEEKEKAKTLLLSAHLNIALCELKLGNDLGAQYACDKVIDIDPNNEKAHFRRGTAHLNQQSFDAALSDFDKVLQISPENKAAKNQITVCNSKVRQAKQKEKQLFSNMFEKFAQIDAQKEKLKGGENQEEKVPENSTTEKVPENSTTEKVPENSTTENSTEQENTVEGQGDQ